MSLRSGASRSADQVYEAGTLTDEPPYYSCQSTRTHRRSRQPFYVVTKGIEPGIYDCW